MVNLIKKEFLLGIGTGFIISGIMVSYLGIGQPTDEQIMARAAKLGMVRTVESMKGESQTSGRVNNSLVPRSDAGVSSGPNKQTRPVQQTAAAGQPQAEETLRGNQDNSGNTDLADTPKTVTIRVRTGMGSEAIARLLEEKAVIKDRNEFYKLVTVHNAHSSFRVGTFEVPAGGDLEEILKILTGK